jgi:hypothetical protein
MAMLLVLVACGPSSSEIRTAKEAHYPGTPYTAFETILAAAKSEDGVVAIDNDSLAFGTTPVWHSYGGQVVPKRGEGYDVHADSLLVAYRVQLVADTKDSFHLTVAPIVVDAFNRLLPPGDKRIPAWVNDETNARWVAFHKKIAQ